jgi:5'(3')-deoxyribonucleotidase
MAIILCDVDGMVADIFPPWLEIYNEDYGDALTMEDLVHYEIQRIVRPACGISIFDIVHDPDFYDNVPPVPGALEGTRYWKRKGHEVLFVTQAGNGATFGAKAAYLVRHGFAEPSTKTQIPANYIHASTATRLLLDGALLLDDNPSAVSAWVNQRRRRAITLAYPFNACLLKDEPSAFWNWCYRADDWADIVRHSERVL